MQLATKKASVQVKVKRDRLSTRFLVRPDNATIYNTGLGKNRPEFQEHAKSQVEKMEVEGTARSGQT